MARNTLASQSVADAFSKLSDSAMLVLVHFFTSVTQEDVAFVDRAEQELFDRGLIKAPHYSLNMLNESMLDKDTAQGPPLRQVIADHYGNSSGEERPLEREFVEDVLKRTYFVEDDVRSLLLDYACEGDAETVFRVANVSLHALEYINDIARPGTNAKVALVEFSSRIKRLAASPKLIAAKAKKKKAA